MFFDTGSVLLANRRGYRGNSTHNDSLRETGEVQVEGESEPGMESCFPGRTGETDFLFTETGSKCQELAIPRNRENRLSIVAIEKKANPIESSTTDHVKADPVISWI